MQYLNLGSDVDLHDSESDDDDAIMERQRIQQDENYDESYFDESEMETMDQYRDRIFGQLQAEINKRNNEKKF